MKILHLNTDDIRGGAARAASRLNEGLQRIGQESFLLVQHKKVPNPSVLGAQWFRGYVTDKLRCELDQFPLRFYPRSSSAPFSLGWLPRGVSPKVSALSPDLVQLHWVGRGFVPLGALQQLESPLVWTLHDSWPFTGGCHLPGECVRYQQLCGRCPQLGGRHERDLSRWTLRRKARLWDGLDLTIVAPSRFLAESARSSSLFRGRRIEVIPNGLDLHRYHPVKRDWAREFLGLPKDRKLILFGAVDPTSDPNKGFVHLQSALARLANGGWVNQAEVLVFGAVAPQISAAEKLKTHYLGALHDDVSLALYYAAADLFVLPSQQENLPNTIMEAMACGTPCAAFDIGGIPDMIDHQENGYLARPFEAEDLAQGVAWVLESTERQRQLGEKARRKAEQNWGIEDVARRYADLYREVLEGQGRGKAI